MNITLCFSVSFVVKRASVICGKGSNLRTIPALVLAAIMVSLVLAGCTPPAVAPPASPTPGAGEATPGKEAWEQKWDSTLAAARKEGALVVYALWGPRSRGAVSQAFKEKFGIDVEFAPFGRGAELLARMQAEKRAGLNVVDVLAAGGPTLIATVKPTGLLGRIQPLLFLPEVVDQKMWKGGQLPFSDREGSSIAQLATAQRFMIYNTDLVRQGELTSYKDALKPQYRDKVVLNDPSVTGSGNAVLSHLALNIWNVEEAKDFLRRVVKEQRAEITRDNRITVESVARGKHAIALGARVETQADFLAVGAPIAQALTPDVFLSHADSVLGVPTVSPHPNATSIFVNWLLSKEGHAVFVRGAGNPGLRVDAPTEGINAIFFTRPEEKLYLDSEQAILFRGEMLEIARQVLAEASR